jgi:hypothetical protein
MGRLDLVGFSLIWGCTTFLVFTRLDLGQPIRLPNPSSNPEIGKRMSANEWENIRAAALICGILCNLWLKC